MTETTIASVLFVHAPLAAVVALAAVLDGRRRRIPNWLTASLALAGLAASLVRADLTLWQSAAGLTIGLCVPFVLFALGLLGAGDAKLLGAVGAWVGPGGILLVLLFTGVAGAVLSLVAAVARGEFGRTLRNTALVGMNLLVSRRTNWVSAAEAARSEAPGRRFTLPYAVAILAGLVATQLTMVLSAS